MKILAIIQARLGSTRLPEKVLMPLGRMSVLENVVCRVRSSSLVEEVVVVTTVNVEDLKIVRLCADNDIRVFCGSENDVLDRFYQLAKLLKPEHIVRITADCPLMDPDVIDTVLKVHLLEKNDYTSNTLIETYPDGEDVEVFNFESLERAWKEAELTSEREHVTPYIKKHPELFRIRNIENGDNNSSKRWTLDNVEDYQFLTEVYNALDTTNPLFGMNIILEFLKKRPELEKLNNHLIRNEGYNKSLKEDSKVKFRENK